MKTAMTGKEGDNRGCPELAQLWLNLDASGAALELPLGATEGGTSGGREDNLAGLVQERSDEGQGKPPGEGELTEACRRMLGAVGLPGAARLVEVRWNPRLRSTAGYACFPAWRIELNPRLTEFEGQTERTLKHELAHLIAYHRAGRRRIDPHGAEWREACVMLGIPDEKACHHLPLPRSRQKRSLAYQCPACGYVVQRVRRFRRPTACLSCCNRLADGRYDARFAFVLLSSAARERVVEGRGSV